MSACLSVQSFCVSLSFCLSTSPSICSPVVCLCPSACPYVYSSFVCLCLSVCPPVCLNAVLLCVSVCLSTSPSVCSPVVCLCLSVSQCAVLLCVTVCLSECSPFVRLCLSDYFLFVIYSQTSKPAFECLSLSSLFSRAKYLWERPVAVFTPLHFLCNLLIGPIK
jgi:hypothetical protein